VIALGRVLGVALVATTLVRPAAQAAPASQPADTPDQQLLAAVEHYQRSEFDEARVLLRQILARVGQQRSRTAQEAHTYLAFVLVAFADTDGAVEAFQRALAIRPELTLRVTSPRIVAAFEEARRRYRARIRALDHDPPLQHHTPLAADVPYGRPLLISDEASDPSGVQRVLLNYRVRGLRGFSSVTMERDVRGRFVATIPASAVVRPGVEYYLEAWDTLGNGPGLKGSSAAPIFVAVRGGPLAAPARSAARPPWYKRWWVWAATAGVVAAAGAVGAAVYFTRSETARFDVHLNKDLNP
jgi:hypothetical protein